MIFAENAPAFLAAEQQQFNLDFVEQIGSLVERFGFALVLSIFLAYLVYRLFFDYIRELKEALVRSEAGRERAEGERDEIQEAFMKFLTDMNDERKGLVSPMTEFFNKIKKDEGDRGG